MEKYLAPDADIVHSPAFESGVIKIATGKPLSEEEVEACRGLERKKNQEPVSDGAEAESTELTTFQRLQLNRKRRKRESSSDVNAIQYIDARKLICATSAIRKSYHARDSAP